jgi:protein-tyrosine kinase
MNLWEDVYSRHKEGGKGPVLPEMQPNPILSDPLSDITQSTGFRSFEEMYYRNTRKPPTGDERATEPRQQTGATASQIVEERKQPSRTISKGTTPQYTPRRQSGTLSVPYPAILAKMSYSLSDIWSNILIGSEQDIRTLLVCGSTRKEGNTLISYHLAMFLSKECAMRALYIDTNLNHEPVQKIRNLPGLYNFVSEGKDLASFIVKTQYPGLYLLPSGAGTIGRNLSSNILTREPIKYLIQFCRDHFDIAVIDGQPFTQSPIMYEFAKKVDMTLMVCRFGVSRQEVSKLVVEKLMNCKAKSLGVILNDRQFIVPHKLYKLLG